MPQYQLHLLGSFQLFRGEVSVIFRSEKERALLAYLAVETLRPHSREALAGLLWPELPDDIAHNNLRVTLHRVRQVVGDLDAAQPLLDVSREAIRLTPSGLLWIDVSGFEELLSKTEQHGHENLAACQECMAWYVEAAALYRGEFLQGVYPTDSLLFSEWALLKREHLHRQALQAMYFLAAYYLRRGELGLALGYAQRQLHLEPWREEAHCQVMTILAMRGEHSAALRQYERCRQVLREELGVEPAEETQGLYERILASRRRRRHNLPKQPTPFIGRKDELNRVSDYLANPDCRLLTILGPGGIGKSHLALQVAMDQIYAHFHGVFLVQLAAVISGEGIVTSIANALEILFQPSGGDPKTQLFNYLHEKDLLLVLDNFEHLQRPGESPDGVEVLKGLLENAPGVQLLVTSRQRLNLNQEWVFKLQGLSFPVDVFEADTERYEAVQLFLQCARRTEPEFQLSRDMDTSVLRICQLLQGIPLAIELSSTWVRVMSPQQIVEEIERSRDFLSYSYSDAPQRHRSLRAVFDQSWHLLSPDEQRIFSELSVFLDGFTRQAAFEVCGASMINLEGLLDKSFISSDHSGRYQIHQLLRMYGEERLIQAGGQAQVKDRHLRFYHDWAKSHESSLIGNKQSKWLQTLEDEYGNLQAALEWSLKEKTCPDLGLSLVVCLGRYWLFHGHWHEGQDWLEAALASVPPEKNIDLRTQATYWLALIVIQCGELDYAADLVTEALEYLDSTNDPNSEAYCLDILGLVARQRGNGTEATQMSLRSLELFRAVGNDWGCTQALNNLFRIAYRQNEYHLAEEYAQKSLELSQALGDIWHIAITLVFLGILAHDRGDLKMAEEFLLDSQKAAKQLRSPLLIAHARYWLARVKSADLAIEEAEVLLNECLGNYRDLGNRWGISVALHGLSQCALYKNRYASAYQFVIEAIDLQRKMGDQQLIALFQSTLGEIYLARSNLDLAEQSFISSLRTLFELADWSTLLNPLRGLVKLYFSCSQDELASHLAGIEASTRDRLGIAISQLDATSYLPAVQGIQMRLTQYHFERLYEAGRKLHPREILPLLPIEPVCHPAAISH